MKKLVYILMLVAMGIVIICVALSVLAVLAFPVCAIVDGTSIEEILEFVIILIPTLNLWVTRKSRTNLINRILIWILRHEQD